MPSTPLPVVLATLALRRRLKQLADMLVPPQIAMLDLGEGVGGVQVAAAMPLAKPAVFKIAAVEKSAPMIAKLNDATRGRDAVAKVRPQAVAMLDRKLLSDNTLGDILKNARSEARLR